jgi:hypothetical protein
VRIEGLLFATLMLACSREETQGTTTNATTANSPSSTSSTTSAIDASAAGDDATSDVEIEAGATTIDAAADVVVQPSLSESDGAPLPQTDAFPSVESGSFLARIDLLWKGIVRDDPQVSERAFFPLVAYQQVKAIPNPAVDFKSRLLGAFARDVHKYHQQLGADAASARFVRIDVPTAKAKWMEPGSEGNKLGYDRVLDSTIVFVDGAGKEHTLAVKSMISWRGEWYVVHLAGFK